MPCMGPAVNDIQFQNAYKDIMKLLRDKYGIQRDNSILSLFGAYHKEKMLLLRTVANNRLKEAIHDVFFRQACEDF